VRAAPAADEGAKARALLEGQAATAVAATKSVPSAGGRFVVQVGAFAEATSVREVRNKVEKLGFKTYTQVVNIDGARRIRVRAGPYPTREEADRAAGQIKSAGLQASILPL
jgi:DedD protein